MDDNQQVRSLVRRALSQHGYQVDVAASLARARQLEPGGYDVLVIDARIGAERGTDLIDELRRQDPAAPARCLLITGGSVTGLPPDVGCLTKPFHPDDLLSAVQARAAPGPASGMPGQPASATQAGPGGTGPGYDLLESLGRLRAAERSAVADFVHDGPLQDLTAALLDLQLTAGDAPPALAGRLAGVARHVGKVAQELRRLVEQDGNERAAGGNLADAVHRRASWLVPEPFTVRVQPASLAAHGAGAALPAVTELALFLLAGHEPPGPAAVSIQLTGTRMEIGLSLSGEPGEAGHRDLEGLAATLGGTARTAAGNGDRQAWITLPAAAPGRETPRTEAAAPETAPAEER